jgi:addiction module RelE/StbE family toxin
MRIEPSRAFQKAYKKRTAKNRLLADLFARKLQKFIQNPYAPELETHKLTGQLEGLWAFSVDYDCRVVFSFANNDRNHVILHDIGSHDQVY